jgi:Bacteriophage HK97-gp10, putative tail-component
VADELIKITGIDEVCAMLTAAPKNIVRGAYGKALAAAAVPIVEALEPRIPSRNNLFDEESFRPLAGTAEEGTLKDALVTDIAIDEEGKGGVLSVGFGGKAGHIANFVEYGHRMIGHKPKLKDLGEVKPYPFMGPAADASADAAIDAFAQSIEESVRTEYGS